jgi:hypothetical protein
MEGKVNVTIRGKAELTKKRHQIDLLLKRAMRGGKQAKARLHKDFGIRVYSSEEIGDYVRERLGTEVIEDSPSRIGAKSGHHGMTIHGKDRRASRRR